MNITFSYTAHLKAAAGATSQTLRVKDGSTLNDCFRTLCDAIPPTLYTSLVDSDGKLRPAILLCVDDQQKTLDDPTPLTDGVEITLLAAISGG